MTLLMEVGTMAHTIGPSIEFPRTGHCAYNGCTRMMCYFIVLGRLCLLYVITLSCLKAQLLEFIPSAYVCGDICVGAFVMMA